MTEVTSISSEKVTETDEPSVIPVALSAGLVELTIGATDSDIVIFCIVPLLTVELHTVALSIVTLSTVELHTVELFLIVEPPRIVEPPLTVEPPFTVELLQTVALSSVALSIVDC